MPVVDRYSVEEGNKSSFFDRYDLKKLGGFYTQVAELKEYYKATLGKLSKFCNGLRGYVLGKVNASNDRMRSSNVHVFETPEEKAWFELYKTLATIESPLKEKRKR